MGRMYSFAYKDFSLTTALAPVDIFGWQNGLLTSCVIHSLTVVQTSLAASEVLLIKFQRAVKIFFLFFISIR